MSVTMIVPPVIDTETAEQRFVLRGIGWDNYVMISDALDERRGIRLIYNQGKLVLMGKSRRHEWVSDCLGYLVIGIATHLNIPCEPAGEATYRRREKEAGLEGDRTFHFGAHAERMRGGNDYDFGEDPPPDLAIEVEVTHSADAAIETWGRMVVPEIWRYHEATRTCSIWRRRADGTYEQTDQSSCLPMLNADDVTGLIALARTTGTVALLAQLPDWVDRVIRSRLET